MSESYHGVSRERSVSLNMFFHVGTLKVPRPWHLRILKIRHQLIESSGKVWWIKGLRRGLL